MGLSPPMTIARRALLANELLISVTANNIANANTPGYARQRAVLNEATPQKGPFGSIGKGVVVSTVEQVVDPFIEARLVLTASQTRDAEVRNQMLARLEGAFPDLEAAGVGKAIVDFFNAVDELVANPQQLGARQALLAAAGTVASEFRMRAGEVQALQRDVDGQLTATIAEINALTGEIAELNRQIAAAEIGGHSSNALRDQRQLALQNLSRKVSITYFSNGDGTINVQTLGSITLVSGASAVALDTALDPSNVGLDGRALTKFGLVNAGGGLIPTGNAIGGGELGALMELRDGVLVDVAADLDTLATALRDAVNGVHADPSGRDLNGDVGGALFDPAASGASDIAVLITDPRKIAAARSSNPGDNQNALAMAALRDTGQASLGDETFTGYHSGIVVTIGVMARSMQDRHELMRGVEQQLSATREAVSGVSLEEEVTNLIKFQRAFQAAASLISTAERMFDELLNLVR